MSRTDIEYFTLLFKIFYGKSFEILHLYKNIFVLVKNYIHVHVIALKLHHPNSKLFWHIYKYLVIVVYTNFATL